MSLLSIDRELYTPEEVVTLSKEKGSASLIVFAHRIEKAWGKQYKDDPKYDYLCMLSAIFTAGYIQGKREERSKRKSKLQPNPPNIQNQL